VLVLAVPAAEPASAEIAAGITAVAGMLCPGAGIRIGYAGDGVTGLAAVLAAVKAEREAAGHSAAGPTAAGHSAAAGNGAAGNGAGPTAAGHSAAAGNGAGHSAAGDGGAPDGGADCPYDAVVVPLAIAPDPGRDAGIAGVADQAGPAVTLTPALGPHPLLAAALHDRLAEARLVAPRRISGLTLVSTAVGVLVCVPGGQAALAAAETVAVLLTARLGVPVAPVLLGSAASLERGVAALREAGASRIAIAPYAVGPELAAGELAAAAAAAGAECAPVLGAHPALGQLVTMRYGAALLDPRGLDPRRPDPAGRVPAAPVAPR
jgi:hypothetical protein